MKKITSVFAGVFALALAFTGCSKKASGPVTVEIWHTYGGQQGVTLNEIVDEFNASQSKYVVKALVQDYSGFADTVYNAVANGVGPSIIFNYGSTAISYAAEGLAVDISKYIAADVKKGDKAMQEIIESLPEAMKTDVKGFSDGGIYYLPGCTTGPVFFYNKTMYDKYGLKAPTTWEELEANSKVIFDNTGKAGFYSDGLVDNLQSLIMTNGLGYIDVPNKKVTFCGDKLAEIYQWYADCCKKGYFEFNTIGRYASEDLANGDIAAFSGSCVNDQYIQMVHGDELGMAPMICSANGNSFYTGWNRGPIFLKRADDIDKGAYEFTKFFLKPENNAKWAKGNSAIAPYGTTEKVAAYQEYINNLPSTSALPQVQANLSVSGSFPNVPGAAQVRNLIVEYLNNVVDGRLSASDAVKQLEDACNKALNQ